MDLSKREKNDLSYTMAAHYVKLLPCAVVENSDRRAISQVRRQRFPKMQKQLGISGEAVSFASAGQWGITPEGTVVERGETLFPRIDVDKEIEELNRLLVVPKQEEKKEDKKEEAGLCQIGIEDFAKVELRVGEIKACEPVKRAKKLLKITLFDGVGERTIASGIAKWYKPEELVGRHVIVVTNLKPAVLCGVESNGMLLAADMGEGARVIFVDDIPAGSKIR